MVTTTPTADTIAQRRGETLARLARQYPHYVATPDTITGGHIVRNPRIPGRIELVSPSGACTCNYGRTFGICRHVAIVETLEGQG